MHYLKILLVAIVLTAPVSRAYGASVLRVRPPDVPAAVAAARRRRPTSSLLVVVMVTYP